MSRAPLLGSSEHDWIGATCQGCRYGVGGVYPGDGSPPVDDDGRKMTWFEGEWRCWRCMDDVRHYRRMECEAATDRLYAEVRLRKAMAA